MSAPNQLKFGVAMLTQEQKTILGKLGYYISYAKADFFVKC